MAVFWLITLSECSCGKAFLTITFYPNLTIYPCKLTSTIYSRMNFEPADPPLLDPFILERFTEEEIRKQEQTLRHKYVLKKLADFLPKQNNSVKDNNVKQQIQDLFPDSVNTHISKQITSQLSNQLSNFPLFPYPAGLFPPNVHVQNTPAPFSFQSKDSPVPFNFQSKDSQVPFSFHSKDSPVPFNFQPKDSQVPFSFQSKDSPAPFSFQSRDTLPLLSMSQQSQVANIRPPSPPSPHRQTNVIKPRATKRFTYSQSAVLEEFFQKYGSARIVDRIALAQKLGLYKNDVIGWFQSRRRKERRATSGGSTYSQATVDQNNFAQNGNIAQICSSGVR